MSLPCYTQANVDKQRVTMCSVVDPGLQKLNAGVRHRRHGAQPNLVYNRSVLTCRRRRTTWRLMARELGTYGVVFNRLYTLANMPIKRFGSTPSRGTCEPWTSCAQRKSGESRRRHVDAVSVDYRGYLYDCDFNQMLGIPLVVAGKRDGTSRISTAELGDGRLRRDHCYGCTAGQ
jgi:hypothetical protein